MQKVLITGGAGFVGSNVAISLKIDNPSWHIISFDNLHRRGSDLNIKRLNKNGVEFVHGDIRIVNDLENINGFDLLIECFCGAFSACRLSQFCVISNPDKSCRNPKLP